MNHLFAKNESEFYLTVEASCDGILAAKAGAGYDDRCQGKIPRPKGEGAPSRDGRPGEGYRTKLFFMWYPSPGPSGHPLPSGEGRAKYRTALQNFKQHDNGMRIHPIARLDDIPTAGFPEIADGFSPWSRVDDADPAAARMRLWNC